jgi:ATP adenylyltransferase
MKRLWAPWRIEYIVGPKENECLFCRVLNESKDRENLVLLRGERCFCMLNRYPYNSGHLLIVPASHCRHLADLPENEIAETIRMAQQMERLLARTMRPEGLNLGFNVGRTAGAGIEEHLHLHLVPRWDGDTNFMVVLDDTRVVVQALEDTYDYLAKALKVEEAAP